MKTAFGQVAVKLSALDGRVMAATPGVRGLPAAGPRGGRARARGAGRRHAPPPPCSSGWPAPEGRPARRQREGLAVEGADAQAGRPQGRANAAPTRPSARQATAAPKARQGARQAATPSPAGRRPRPSRPRPRRSPPASARRTDLRRRPARGDDVLARGHRRDPGARAAASCSTAPCASCCPAARWPCGSSIRARWRSPDVLAEGDLVAAGARRCRP